MQNERSKTEIIGFKKQVDFEVVKSEHVLTFNKTNRFKSEIVDWALNCDLIEEKCDFADHFKTIDDKYLSYLGEKNTHKESQIFFDPIDSKNKVYEVLAKIKQKKEASRRNCKSYLDDQFDVIVGNMISANSYYEKSIIKSNQETQISFPMPKIELNVKKKQSVNDENFLRAAREANQKARVETFNLIKSGKVRMVPGNLKHNVAIERVLLKDLLKLSKERYSLQKESEVLKSNFIASQAKKGIPVKFKKYF